MRTFLMIAASAATVFLLGLSVAVPAVHATATPDLRAPYKARIQADFEQRLRARAPAELEGAFVHFRSTQPGDQQALLKAHGLELVSSYLPYAPAAFAVGPVSGLLDLLADPGVSYLEENRQLQYLGDTGPWATRLRAAQEAVAGGPYLAPDGMTPLSGAGVAIAVVDSGLNGLHPDFAGRVDRNYKVLCTTPGLINTTTGVCFGDSLAPGMGIVIQDLGPNSNTDNTGGHGTHVTGIAAGSGAASTGPYPVAAAAPRVRGTFTGAAPGARIVAYGAGETLLVLTAAESFKHILDNYDDPAVFPTRIRAINNSYGDAAGTPHDPEDISSRLGQALVAKGVAVVYAAGNGDANGNGGNGTADRTSSFCKDPTPGIICVANYNDANTGNVDNILAPSSSRGVRTDLTSYPDIAAPGTSITASCTQPLPGQTVCTNAERRWQPHYGTISGTSMATPHVVGTLALLFEARPDLSPAAAETLIQNTARKVRPAENPYEPDPQNPGATVHFGFGAGLLNVQAALDALGIPSTGSTGGAAAITITAPMTDAVFDGSVPIEVAGTFQTGAGTATSPPSQVIFDGDVDNQIPGAADIVSLSVEETPAGIETPGLRYTLTLRGTDFPPTGTVEWQLSQNVNGRPFLSILSATAAAVTPSASATSTAKPTEAVRDGTVVNFFIPFANLGEPPAGAIAHNVFTNSFAGLLVDTAPGNTANLGLDRNTQPMFGRPYTILRPEQAVLPSAQVRVSVNNGPEEVASINGEGPGFSWNITALDAASLGNGQHLVSARLLLDGAPAAQTSTRFEVVLADEVEPGDINAALSSDSTGGKVPATVNFDASASRYADGSPLVQPQYTFVFGDGERLGPQPEPTAAYTYETAGRFSAYVIVTDRNGGGQVSESNRIQIDTTVEINVTPGNETVAQLRVIGPRSGPVPLQVTFDGSDSFARDGEEIVRYTFDFGDGSPLVSGTAATVRHTYTVPGRYEPTLTVTDSADQTAMAKASVQINPDNTTPGALPAPGRRGSGALGLWLLLPLLAVAVGRRRRRR